MLWFWAVSLFLPPMTIDCLRLFCRSSYILCLVLNMETSLLCLRACIYDFIRVLAVFLSSDSFAW